MLFSSCFKIKAGAAWRCWPASRPLRRVSGSPFLWAPSDRRAFALRCGIRNSAPQYLAVPCRRDSHATSFALCRTLRQTIAEWRGECDHAFSHPSAPRQTCYIAGHAVALRALGSLLAKDTAQIETHFALANLWMARKMLWRPTKTEGASSRCSDCRQDATGSRLTECTGRCNLHPECAG
jgi:hypothetical protein